MTLDELEKKYGSVPAKTAENKPLTLDALEAKYGKPVGAGERNITPPDPVEPLMATKKKDDRDARDQHVRASYEQQNLAALQSRLDAANNTRKVYVGKQKDLQKTSVAGSKELLQNAEALRSAEAAYRDRKAQLDAAVNQQKKRAQNTLDTVRAERKQNNSAALAAGKAEYETPTKQQETKPTEADVTKYASQVGEWDTDGSYTLTATYGQLRQKITDLAHEMDRTTSREAAGKLKNEMDWYEKLLQDGYADESMTEQDISRREDWVNARVSELRDQGLPAQQAGFGLGTFADAPQKEKTPSKADAALLKEQQDLESELLRLGQRKRAFYYKRADDLYKTLDSKTQALVDEAFKYGEMGTGNAAWSADQFEKRSGQIKQRTGWDSKTLGANLDLLKYKYDQDAGEAMRRLEAEDAKKRPLLTSLFSVGANTVTAVPAYVDLASQYFGKQSRGDETPINTNTPTLRARQTAGTIRGQVASDIEKNTKATMPKWMGGDNAGVWTYNTLMSAADSAANMAASAALGGPALGLTGDAMSFGTSAMMNVLVGSQVASDQMIVMLNQGAPANQALVTGTLYGAVEGLTEAASVGVILDSILSGRAVWKTLLKSFVSEGGEEVAGNWLDAAVDRIYNGNLGRFEVLYQNYIAAGSSEKQALAQAVSDICAEDANSFLAGAVAGLLMGSGSVFTAPQSRKRARSAVEAALQLSLSQSAPAGAAAGAAAPSLSATVSVPGGTVAVYRDGNNSFSYRIVDAGNGVLQQEKGLESREAAIAAAGKAAMQRLGGKKLAAKVQDGSLALPDIFKSPETRAEEAKAAEVTAENPGATVATALAVEIQKAGNVKLADAVKMADIMTRIYDGGEVTGGEIDRLGLLKNPAVRAVFEAKVGMPVDVSTASNMRKSVKEIARQRKTLLAERAAQTAQVAEANEAAAHLEVLQEDNAPAAREAMEQAVAEHTQATEHAQAVAEHTQATEHAQAAPEAAQATEHAQAAPEAAQATEPTQTPEAGTQPGSAIRLADGTEITKQAFVEAMNPKSRAERIVAERAFDGLLATAEATQTKEGINGGNESGGGIEQRASGVAAGEPGESVSREAGTTETGATDQQRRAESIRIARDMIRQHGSEANVRETAEEVRVLATEIAEGKLTDKQAKARAEAIAGGVLGDIYILLNEGEIEAGKDLRSFLQANPIHVSEKARKDIHEYGKWARSNLPFMTTNKGGNSLDSVYQELTAMYGEGRFPSDITAASEQLERIAEVLREAAPSYGNLFREGSEALAEERAKLGDKILAEAKAIDVKKEGRDATIRERIQEARKGDPFQSAKFQDFIRQYDETYGEGASDRALRSAKELQRAFEREIRRTEDLAYRVNAEKTKAEAKRLISQAAQERKIKAEKRKLDAFRKKANATIREQDNTIAHAAKLIAAYDEAQKKTEQKHKREMTEQKAIAARNLEREKYRGQIKLNDALMSAKIKEGRKLEQQKRKTKEAKEEGKQKVAEARALSSKAAKEARRELSRRREETVRSMDNAEVDTLRKMPGNKTFKDRLAAAAKKIQTVGRDLYSTFVTETLELERLGHLQAANGAEGVTAYEAAKIAAACNSTISLALDRALYDHEGNVIGGALRDVVAVWDGKKIDMERQAYLQDYMLHLHNVDRMSIRAKARKKVEVFEAQNPWLKVIDSKEFALIAVGKDARSEIAREYVKLAKAERMAKDKPVFQDSENVPISAETSRKIAEQYEADMPWVKEKAQGIYDWWDVFMREWAVGRSISLEEYEALQEMYPHYVPTFRAGESETGANYIGRGSATVGKAIGRATGGTSEVRFIEDSYASLVGRTIRIARMNDLYMNIIETAMNDDAGAFDGFCVFDWENAPGDMAAYQNWLLDRDVFNNNDTPNVTLEKIGSEYRVNAWLEGERISAYISEELYQSLMAVSKTKSGTAIERDVDKAVKIGNFLTGPMKTMITGINPFFAVRNIARDLPTAVVNSISGLRFYKYWFQAWGKIRHSAEWNQFEALGGTHMGYYRNESGLKQGVAAKNWGKKKGLGKHIVSGLGWFNETSESVTRFAEYLATIDKLGDTYEGRIKGIHNAAEVTVDFSRKGSAGKVINAWVPYWNPAVQGVDKVIRSCFEAEAGKSRGAQFLRTTSRAAIVNMLPEAILYAVIKHLGKDDDWEKLSDYTKDNYFCIPLPDKHKFLKIPKNREWGAILGTPLMRILEGIDGRDNNFEHYAEDSLLVNFAPPFFPIIASQAFDLSRNKNFFGGTIIPNEYKDFSSGEFASKTLQWDEDTTIFAKGLSDAMFNALSPMQIDYIIHDYCGDFVSTFIDLFDMESWQAATGDAPEGYTVGGDVLESVKSLTDSFVADNRYSSFVTGEYYELMDELGRTVKDNQIKMGEDKAKESIEYKTRSAILSSFGKEISALNKQVRSMADGTEKDNAKFQITILAQKTLDFYEKCMSGKISEPTLYVKYDVYDWKVRDELMAMAKYNDGYTFEPTTFSPSAKLTDPNNKKKEYVFTPEQKSQYRYLFQENYERVVLRLLRSTEYERATGTARAELLEDAYYEARESAKKDLFAWLKEMGAPSTPKK